jgi:hypothetical protein
LDAAQLGANFIEPIGQEQAYCRPRNGPSLEAYWREDFEEAQAPDFRCCLGPNQHLEGAAARRVHYRDRGIPREFVRRWSEQHRRRNKTIRKLETYQV